MFLHSEILFPPKLRGRAQGQIRYSAFEAERVKGLTQGPDSGTSSLNHLSYHCPLRLKVKMLRLGPITSYHAAHTLYHTLLTFPLAVRLLWNLLLAAIFLLIIVIIMAPTVLANALGPFNEGKMLLDQKGKRKE